MIITQAIEWLPITDEVVEVVESHYINDWFEVLLTNGQIIDGSYHISVARERGFTHCAIVGLPFRLGDN